MNAQGPEPGDYYSAPKSRALTEIDEFGRPIKPGVVTWFKVYAAALGVLYLLLAGLMAIIWAGLLLSDPAELAQEDISQQDRAIFSVLFPAFGLFSAVLAGVFLAPLFLPRKPWVWIYSIVLIAIGLTSCALWPATIPLMIFWIRPEVRRYYGQAVAEAGSP